MPEPSRLQTLLADARAKGDELGWFEPLYAAADGDDEAIPWHHGSPNPHLVAWLDRDPPPTAPGRAMVVGCGLGDDAEELARRGHDVRAFDLAGSAIKRCKARFPDTAVDYRAADVLDLPSTWRRRWDLVVEIYTLQTLRGFMRQQATLKIADLVAPGGTLLVICGARDEDEPEGTMPMPLTRSDLRPLEGKAGLRLIDLEDFREDGENDWRHFRASYVRDA